MGRRFRWRGRRRFSTLPSRGPHRSPKHTYSAQCTPIKLPSGGVIVFGAHSTTTLSQPVLFKPLCTQCPVSNGSDTCFDDTIDPFYASTTPIVYVIAVCTIFAWTLLIVLLISPNNITSFRCVNSSAIWQSSFSRATTSFFNGSRPWLQKVGALLTAISMIVATADLFKVTEDQYARGVYNAHDVRNAVAGSVEIKALRVVADLFLWLAQIQTLIRVFPRHKEKLLIKWIGFFLILLDIVFSCLHGFYVTTDAYSPSRYSDAISALAYLFQLSLSLLYATWIIYYAATKRRYAFYHITMPNISIVAAVSLLSILIPVGFFIADMIVPDVSGWGDYFRWVSAAASSIVVWEWVERIESIERDEKKDGILGREIFEGDDMIDDTPSGSRGRGHRSSSQGDSGIFKARNTLYSLKKLVPYVRPDSTTVTATGRPSAVGLWQSLPSRILRRPGGAHAGEDVTVTHAPPDQIHSAGPVDRSQAASADSTIYHIQYHAERSSATPPAPPVRSVSPLHTPRPQHSHGRTATVTFNTEPASQCDSHASVSRPKAAARVGLTRPLRIPSHLFKRARKSPPIEIKNARSLDAAALGASTATDEGGNSTQTSIAPAPSESSRLRFGSRARLSGIGSDTSRMNSIANTVPTVIPAPPRGHTWSPEDRRHSPLAAIRGGGTPGTVGQKTPTPQPASGSGPISTGSQESRSGSEGISPQGGSSSGLTNETPVEGMRRDESSSRPGADSNGPP